MSAGHSPSAGPNLQGHWAKDMTAPGTGVIWLTIYSDLMTNLMLFFLTLFALGLMGDKHVRDAAESIKQATEGRNMAAEAQRQEAPQAKNLEEFLLKMMDKEQGMTVEQGGEGVRLRLPEPVLFDSGRAVLKPEASLILTDISNGLKNLDYTVVVEGHTDDVPLRGGLFKSNWELSEARAESVVNYLIQQEGFPPKRLAVAGYGEYWPFVPNTSPTNRALNRRIELLVILNEK